jgi:hypothetical protein
MALDPVTGAEAYDPKKIIGSQTQVDDSVAAQVTKLASQDSALNKMARTEGLKAANRRGLLNSSMAVGAAQDAVLQNVLPIAQQEANQAFQKNMQARGFEYTMAGQEHQQTWQSAENVAARGWQTAENIAQRGFIATQADLDRTLQQTMQANQLSHEQAQLVKQIASTEGIAAAQMALQKELQEADIQFRMKEGQLDRASAERMQAADIAFQKAEGAATRNLQAQIAQWNLKSADRASAAQMVTNMQSLYNDRINQIMANTKLSSSARQQQLTQARNQLNSQMSLVEQTYNVDLHY